MNPKVSIGIPLYNTEKYLKKCLDSVVNQTLQEIEIILVNDCSPDNSISIAREYQARDNRIVIIEHEINQGSGGARNTVIKNARADYIGFIDSDDYVEANMYEVMYNKAIANDADMVVCGVKKISEETAWLRDFIKYDKEIVITNCLETYLNTDLIIAAVYQKLFRKKIFLNNSVYFPLEIFHQDIVMMPKYMYYCNKIVLLKEQFYYYYQRKGSAVHSMNEKHIESIRQVLKLVKNFLVEKNIYQKYKNYYWRSLFLGVAIKFHFQRTVRKTNDLDARNSIIQKSIESLCKETDFNELFSVISSDEIIDFLYFKIEKEKLEKNIQNLNDIQLEMEKTIKRLEENITDWNAFPSLSKRKKIFFILKKILKKFGIK